jgi:hypothetical protein
VGCDEVLGSGLVSDSCGVCGGNNTCVGCDGVPGSGKEFDSCGVCGGMNRTCFCLEGEGAYPAPQGNCVVLFLKKIDIDFIWQTGVYRGFDQSELDKVLLLYQIEQSIASLEEVDTKLGKLYDVLTTADPEKLDLGDQIDELRSWSSECFDGFCTNLEQLFTQLGVDYGAPVSKPVCGFSY